MSTTAILAIWTVGFALAGAVFFWPEVERLVERARLAYHRWRIRRATRQMTASIRVTVEAVDLFSDSVEEAAERLRGFVGEIPEEGFEPGSAR